MALNFKLPYKVLPRWQNAAYVLQLFSALTFINTKLAMVSSTLSSDLAIEDVINDNYERAVNSLASDALEKRTWQQLQNPWGKRAVTNDGWTIEPTDDGSLLAERWVPVLAASGGSLSQHRPEVLKYSMIYLTNAATLKQLANQHDARSLSANDEDDDGGYKLGDDLFAPVDKSDNDDNNLLNEKRNWKSMNAAWGKRRNEPAWNKFRGAWGKRQPGWNNLKGMWGKRGDWQKLHAGWGKRSQDPAEVN